MHCSSGKVFGNLKLEAHNLILWQFFQQFDQIPPNSKAKVLEPVPPRLCGGIRGLVSPFFALAWIASQVQLQPQFQFIVILLEALRTQLSAQFSQPNVGAVRQ